MGDWYSRKINLIYSFKKLLNVAPNVGLPAVDAFASIFASADSFDGQNLGA